MNFAILCLTARLRKVIFVTLLHFAIVIDSFYIQMKMNLDKNLSSLNDHKCEYS